MPQGGGENTKQIQCNLIEKSQDEKSYSTRSWNKKDITNIYQYFIKILYFLWERSRRGDGN